MATGCVPKDPSGVARTNPTGSWYRLSESKNFDIQEGRLAGKIQSNLAIHTFDVFTVPID